MGFLNHVVRGWQKMPLSWRQGLVASSVAPVARRLVNRFYPSRPQVVELAAPLDGYRMRLHWQTHKAYAFGTYEPQVTQAILDKVQPACTVVDVGAHIGYFTLLLSKLVGPGGRVIAFEALSEIFAVLDENVHLNSCQNTTLENKAVAASAGRLTLGRVDEDPLTSTAALGFGRPVAKIESISLDEYLSASDAKISFVKIDAEGAEDAVLEGARGTLQRDRPLLLIEMHGFDAQPGEHPALRRLHEFGYGIRYLDGLGAQVHVLAEPASQPEHRMNSNP